MKKKNSFNEAVATDNLEMLLANTKKACASIVHGRGYILPPHLDVEDISQDAVMKLIKALETYDETKSTANTFCDRVINNLITDHIRRAILESKHRTSYSTINGDDSNESEDSKGNSMNNVVPTDRDSEDINYMTEILIDTTKVLTERQRQVFILRQKGYTRIEIGEKLGVSVRTVAGDWSVVSKVLLDLIY